MRVAAPPTAGPYLRWSLVKAVLLSLVLTFIPFFDIPVFWPILVIYFFALCFMCAMPRPQTKQNSQTWARSALQLVHRAGGRQGAGESGLGSRGWIHADPSPLVVGAGPCGAKSRT